jgi:hypothetical protein
VKTLFLGEGHDFPGPTMVARNFLGSKSSPFVLNPEVEDFAAVQGIFKLYDPGMMRHYPLSPRVNSAQNEDADSAAPITLETPAHAQLF